MACATEEGGTIKDQLALFLDFLQVSDLNLSSISYALSFVCMSHRKMCLHLMRHGHARVQDAQM